jgi:cytochrome c5
MHTQRQHKVLQRKLSRVGVLLGVPLLVVLGLVNAYKKQDGAAPASMSEEAVMSRIQKVGRLSLGASQQALRTGEEVYKVQCTTCHAAGLLGAPKFSDATAWGPRVKLGYDSLLASALKGKGSMTPQGGGAFSDLRSDVPWSIWPMQAVPNLQSPRPRQMRLDQRPPKHQVQLQNRALALIEQGLIAITDDAFAGLPDSQTVWPESHA